MFLPPERAAGYDRTPVMYDPRGRILQILYARRAVSQGTPSCGILFNDGALVAGRRKMSALLMPNKKVFQVDEYIVATFAGYSSDGIFLVEQARDRAATLRFVYGSEKPDVYLISRYVSLIMHQATLYAGLRPFGVSMIIAGKDLTGSHLYFNDPGGSTVKWRAGIIGKNAHVGEKFLMSVFKKMDLKNIDFELAVKYAIAAISIASGALPTAEEIEIGFVRADEPAIITTASSAEIRDLYSAAAEIFDEWKSKKKIEREAEEEIEEESEEEKEETE